jgi:hypothetical protein
MLAAEAPAGTGPVALAARGAGLSRSRTKGSRVDPADVEKQKTPDRPACACPFRVGLPRQGTGEEKSRRFVSLVVAWSTGFEVWHSFALVQRRLVVLELGNQQGASCCGG